MQAEIIIMTCSGSFLPSLVMRSGTSCSLSSPSSSYSLARSMIIASSAVRDVSPFSIASLDDDDDDEVDDDEDRGRPATYGRQAVDR